MKPYKYYWLDENGDPEESNYNLIEFSSESLAKEYAETIDRKCCESEHHRWNRLATAWEEFFSECLDCGLIRCVVIRKYELEKYRYEHDDRTETSIEKSESFEDLLEKAKKMKLKSGVTFMEELVIVTIDENGDRGEVFVVKGTEFKESKKKDRDLLGEIFYIPEEGSA